MRCLLALTLALVVGSPASATILYSEGFDDASADVTTVTADETAITYVDYSSFTVGTTNFSVPEAPRQVAGSAATSGVLMQVNMTAPAAAAAINLVAGATPIAFTGDYRVSFDAYISVENPPPTGGTEQLLWAVGSGDESIIKSRLNRASTDGTFGWLAGENGYGTEDAAIFDEGVELADLGDTQPGEAAPFNDAFTTNFGGNDLPALSWVEVDILVKGGVVSVSYNGVEFFSEAVTDSDGFAALGYEDPFSSVSLGPDSQWGLFDNFTVTFVPEPTTAMLAAFGCVALARRRR